jgi:hypothetical protein
MARTASVILAVVTLAAAQWAWEPCAPLPESRYSGAAVALGGRVYYLGGSAAGGQKTNSVFVYHPREDSWSVGDSMPEARHRFGAVQRDSSIYVFGGWGDGGVLLNSAWRYDVGSRIWTAIETLPARRASVFAAADPTVHGKVYCIGGWDGVRAYGDNFEYDPATGHWRERAPMPTPRCEGACLAYMYPAVCVGGTSDGSTLVSTVEFYDDWDDAWYTWVPSPVARMGMAAVRAPGVRVLGGVGAGNVTLAANWRIDYHNVWEEHEPLPEPRRYLAACLCSEDTLPYLSHVYAIGGQDSLQQPSPSVWRWEPYLSVEPEQPPLRAASARARIVRPGDPLPRPAGACADGVVCDVGGRVVKTVRSGDACPNLAAGTYLVRWRRGAATSPLRLLVVR